RGPASARGGPAGRGALEASVERPLREVEVDPTGITQPSEGAALVRRAAVADRKHMRHNAEAIGLDRAPQREQRGVSCAIASLGSGTEHRKLRGNVGDGCDACVRAGEYRLFARNVQRLGYD